MAITAISIAKLINKCYDELCDINLSSGAASDSDAAIANFRKQKLDIATDCVFAELGINRQTSQRM